MNRVDLEEYEKGQQEAAKAASWRSNVQQQLNSGVAPGDIVWPTPTTKLGRETLEQIKEELTVSTRAKMKAEKMAKGQAAMSGLSDSQIANIESSVPNSFDGNDVLTDVGRDAAIRFDATNRMNSSDKAEMEAALKQSLAWTPSSRMAGGPMAPTTYKWAQYVNGEFVLTDEGVQEVNAREAQRKELFVATKKTVTDGPDGRKEVIEYTPKDEHLADAWNDLASEWRRANPNMSMGHAQMMQLHNEARMLTGVQIHIDKNGNFMFPPGAVERAKSANRELWYYKDGNVHTINPELVGTGGTGAGAGTGGGVPSTGRASVADQIITSSAHVSKLRQPFSYTQNLEFKDVETTIDQEDWDVSVAANVGTHYKKLRALGWSEDDTKDFLDEMLDIDATRPDPGGDGDYSGGTELGSDTHGLIELGVNYYASKMDEPSEAFWDEIENTYGTTHGTVWREADELTWGKMAKSKEWKDLMKLDANDWDGKSITFNYQHESWSDQGVPDTRGRHRLPLRNHKQRTFTHTFNADEENLPKICLLYTSPSPRDGLLSRMPSSA